MSVRKRKWTTRKGEPREAWIVDYVDQTGSRHIETFARKRDADARADEVGVGVRAGTHTAPSRSITVAEAADDWIAYVESERRERATVTGYKEHLKLHLLPRIGNRRIARLTQPDVEKLRDELVAELSRPLAKKVLARLKSILADARRRGNVAQNVAQGVRIDVAKRGRKRLTVGVDIPTPEEVRTLVHSTDGRMRAMIVTAAFAGLRASELRGLRWQDVDLANGRITVAQRADRYNEIGPPKSETSARTIPVGPHVVNTLKAWKVECPPGDLAFPTRRGGIEHHPNLDKKIQDAMRAAGIVDKDGEPKYAVHALRHFYASWCINRRVDGGLELPLKVVQARLGHSSITMTADIYGHLFPTKDDGAELAEAEAALFAVQ